MGNLRKIVGVSLAVALVAALAVYVLIPRTGPTANAVVNEPQAPPSSGTGPSSPTGTGSGSTPTPATPPPTRPAKAHGENSHGPKHVVCLPEKDHDGNGVSQYQGANQYRGQCPADARPNAYGHSHGANENAVAWGLLTRVRVGPGSGLHG